MYLNSLAFESMPSNELLDLNFELESGLTGVKSTSAEILDIQVLSAAHSSGAKLAFGQTPVNKVYR